MFNLIGRSDKVGSGFDVFRNVARYANVEPPTLEAPWDEPTAVDGECGNVWESAGKFGKTDTGFSASERAALALIEEEGAVSTSAVMQRTRLSERGVQRLLARLTAAGAVERIGAGRSTRYVAAVRRPGA